MPRNARSRLPEIRVLMPLLCLACASMPLGCRSSGASSTGSSGAARSVTTEGVPSAASASAIANAPIATPPASAKALTDGIRFDVVRPATGGPTPRPDSVVVIAYAAWKADGTILDSTYDGRYGADSRYGGAAFTVPVRELTSGLATAVLSMTQGEKRRFWIPWEQARAKGAHKQRPLLDPPYGSLTVDIELAEIH